MWLLWLISQRSARIRGRSIERARAADAGGCGPACLHGLIAAAMSCLSATRNAVIVCLSGRRCHHEKRKCERRRSGGGELLRSRCHSVFFLFLRVPQKNPQRAIPAEFLDRASRGPSQVRQLRLSASQQCPNSLSSLGVQTVMRSYKVVCVEIAPRQNDQMVRLPTAEVIE